MTLLPLWSTLGLAENRASVQDFGYRQRIAETAVADGIIASIKFNF